MACAQRRASRGELPKPASVVAHAKSDAMSLNMARHVPTAVWMRSSASYLRANARSKWSLLPLGQLRLSCSSRDPRKWPTNGIEGSPSQSKGGLPYKSPMFPMSAQPPYEPIKRSEHVPHALCQSPLLHIRLTSTDNCYRSRPWQRRDFEQPTIEIVYILA